MKKIKELTEREIMRIREMLTYGICNNHTGKMVGMSSFSTSCICNKYCLMRMKNGNSICASCFSFRKTARQKTLENKLEKNTDIITKEIYPVEAMPMVLKQIFRLESFGDLNNATQLINYFTLCNANPFTTFALWTKNIWILREVEDLGYEKPRNIIIIQSSAIVNQPEDKKHHWVDKVFTVYDKKYAKDVNINCGSKCCANCQICYRMDTTDVINEIKK